MNSVARWMVERHDSKKTRRPETVRVDRDGLSAQLRSTYGIDLDLRSAGAMGSKIAERKGRPGARRYAGF